MGRLVKAFALDRESARLGNFDEKQFLQEAGQIAARLRSEIAPEPQARPAESRRATESYRSTETSREDASADRDGRGRRESRHSDARNEIASDSPSLRVFGELDDVEALSSVDLALQVGDLEEAREAMGRIRRDREYEQRTTETGRAQEQTRRVQEQVRLEAQARVQEQNRVQTERHFIDEQLRWEERHAAKARHLEDWEARLKAQEDALTHQESNLRTRTSRQVSEVESELRVKYESELTRHSKHLQTAQAELRLRSAETQKLEAEVADLRRIVDEQRERGASEAVEQRERARRMIEDCDRRIMELAAERAAAKEEIDSARTQFEEEKYLFERETTERLRAAEKELEQRREEFARERLEQRSELRTQRETQMREFEETRTKLGREQSEWTARYETEKQELAQQREILSRESATIRTQIGDLNGKRELLEQQVKDLQIAHQDAVERARTEIASLVERERAKLDAQRADFDRQDREFKALAERRLVELDEHEQQRRREIDQQIEAELQGARQQLQLDREKVQLDRAAVQQQIDAWRADKAQQLAAMKEQSDRVTRAQQEMESLAAQAMADRRAVQQERHERETTFEADLERRRVELETTFDRRRQEYETAYRQREAELTQRERLAAQKSAQQEAEAHGRVRQIEHDLRLQVELAQKRLSDDREHFQQQCQRRESDLQNERTELDRQWGLLNEERARVRLSLEQVDQQTRRAASMLDTPSPHLHVTPVAPSMPTYVMPQVDPRGTTRRVDMPLAYVPEPHVVNPTIRHVEPIYVEPAPHYSDYDEADELAASLSARAAQQESRQAQAEVNSGRRAALEQYRARLGELQAQLQDLQTFSKAPTTIGS